MPYLGGVAIVLAVAGSISLLPGWTTTGAAILVGGAAVGVVGLIDDVRNLGPGVRLVAEAAAASVAVAGGVGVQLFGGPLDDVLTVGWLVLVTNAFNLLDNMDGAAAVVAVCTSVTLLAVAMMGEQSLVIGLAGVVGGASLGFLIYNWHPATIYMGDSGSLFLGFILSAAVLTVRFPAGTVAGGVAAVLLVLPALFDTTLVVLSRVRRPTPRPRGRHRPHLAPAAAARHRAAVGHRHPRHRFADRRRAGGGGGPRCRPGRGRTGDGARGLGHLARRPPARPGLRGRGPRRAVGRCARSASRRRSWHPMSREHPRSELELRDYLVILRRRAGTIVAVALVVVAASLVFSYLQTPRYRATAEVLLQPSGAGDPFNPSQNQRADPSRAVHTEIQMLESEPVRAAVRKKLGSVPPVSASSIGETDVIEVRATSTDPQRAARVANAYAEAYVDLRQQQAVDGLLKAVEKIQIKVDELQTQIDALDQQIAQAPPESRVAPDNALVPRRAVLIQQQGAFQGRLDEVQVTANLKTGDAQLVTPAATPLHPDSPQPRRDAVVALVVGLFLGVALALLREHLDDSIKTKDELERVSDGLPTLGIIPVETGWKDRDAALRRVPRRALLPQRRGLPVAADRDSVHRPRSSRSHPADHQPQRRRGQDRDVVESRRSAGPGRKAGRPGLL